MKAPYLNKGDTIGVFSPSSWVEKSDIELSARYVEAQGLKTFVHPQTYAATNNRRERMKKSYRRFMIYGTTPIFGVYGPRAGVTDACIGLIISITQSCHKRPKPSSALVT